MPSHIIADSDDEDVQVFFPNTQANHPLNTNTNSEPVDLLAFPTDMPGQGHILQWRSQQTQQKQKEIYSFERHLEHSERRESTRKDWENNRQQQQQQYTSLQVPSANPHPSLTTHTSSTDPVFFRTLYAKEQRAALGLLSSGSTGSLPAISTSLGPGGDDGRDKVHVGKKSMDGLWDVLGSLEMVRSVGVGSRARDVPAVLGMENQPPRKKKKKKKKKKRRPIDEDSVSMVPLGVVPEHSLAESLPDTAPTETDAFPRPSQIYPDEETIQSLIPPTASYNPRPGSIYVAPSVMSAAAEREQYTEIDADSSVISSLHFDDSIMLGKRTIPRHVVPSSYAPTIPASTPEELRRGISKDTIVMRTSILRPDAPAGYYENPPVEIPPMQDMTPRIPVSRPKLAKLLRKRKSDHREDVPRRRSSSPDVILGGTTAGGAPLMKKRRSLARGEDVDELTWAQQPQMYGQVMEREPWVPDTAPVAVMEVSRSVIILEDSSSLVGGAMVQELPRQLDIAETEEPRPYIPSTESFPKVASVVAVEAVEEPARSGRSVHEQIADSEDEDDGDMDFIPVRPVVNKAKSPPALVREPPEPSPTVMSIKKAPPAKKQKAKAKSSVLRPEIPTIMESIEVPPIRRSIEQPDVEELKPLKKKKKAAAPAKKPTETAKPKKEIVTVILDSDSEDELSREPTLVDFPTDEAPVITRPVAAPEPTVEPQRKEPLLQPETPVAVKKEKTKQPTRKELAAAKKAASAAEKKAKAEIAVQEATGTATESPAPEPTPAPLPTKSNPRRSESTLSDPKSTAESFRDRSTSTASVSSERPLAVATTTASTPGMSTPVKMAGPAGARASPPTAGTSGRPVYRVGLSRRTRIAPLLKIIRKT